MTRFAIEMNDGSVSIMQIVGGATIQQCLAKWPVSEMAKVLGWREISPEEIPQSRTFRNAWRLQAGKIEHDIERMREIHNGRLRAARAPVLESLDIAYQRADELGDAEGKKVIADRKQALRDITDDPAIVAAASGEGLIASWPTDLMPMPKIYDKASKGK